MPCGAGLRNPQIQPVWSSVNPKSTTKRDFAEVQPFRMEMSGFARHEGSLAIIGDLGAVWPLIASRAAQRLGIQLEFMSYPQQTSQGKAMREWIVTHIRPISRRGLLEALGRVNQIRTTAHSR